MLVGSNKTILTIFIGLSLGGAAGYLSKPSKTPPQPHTADVPFDVAHFAKAEIVESGLSLARQLPSADAEKCAALAKTMLTKRITYNEPSDPFAAYSPDDNILVPLPERVWEGLFKRWMQVAPQSAWEFVLAHHSDEIPLRVAALHQWALLDPAAAGAAAGKEITGDEKRVILSACTESDPACGLALMLEWGKDLSKALDDPFVDFDPPLAELLIQLAKKSPSAALEWCQTHSPESISDVCIGWNRNDPAACLEWIKSRPLEQQEEIMEQVCNQPDVSSLSLRHFASLCKAGDVRETILTGLQTIAALDETLSQALIDELLPNPTDRMSARASIGYILADVDPRKAMQFILPSLREAMPLYETPALRGFCCGVVPPAFRSSQENYDGIVEVWSSYLRLGPEAGIGKEQVLDTLRQIDPQYIPWILGRNFNELKESMGPLGQWLQPLVKDVTREEIGDLIDSFYYEKSEEALKDVKSLSPGFLRDRIIQKYGIALHDNEIPVAEVMDRVKALGDNQADLGELYAYWMDSDPVAAMKHFADNPSPTSNEWKSVINDGYKDHAEQIQTMAEALPPGALRDDVADALAETSLRENSDYITAMYWATEITSREQRTTQIRSMLEKLQSDRPASSNEETIAGIIRNIENSSLSDEEKSRWLDRIENEVLP